MRSLPLSYTIALRQAVPFICFSVGPNLREKHKKDARQAGDRPSERGNGLRAEAWMLPTLRTLISRRTEAKIVNKPSDAAFNVVADGADG